MAVSDITGATSGAATGVTPATGVQRVEQRQLQAAAEAEDQETRQADAGASGQAAATAQASGSSEERTAENTPRGALLDITV